MSYADAGRGGATGSALLVRTESSSSSSPAVASSVEPSPADLPTPNGSLQVSLQPIEDNEHMGRPRYVPSESVAELMGNEEVGVRGIEQGGVHRDQGRVGPTVTESGDRNDQKQGSDNTSAWGRSVSLKSASRGSPVTRGQLGVPPTAFSLYGIRDRDPVEVDPVKLMGNYIPGITELGSLRTGGEARRVGGSESDAGVDADALGAYDQWRERARGLPRDLAWEDKSGCGRLRREAFPTSTSFEDVEDQWRGEDRVTAPQSRGFNCLIATGSINGQVSGCSTGCIHMFFLW